MPTTTKWILSLLLPGLFAFSGCKKDKPPPDRPPGKNAPGIVEHLKNQLDILVDDGRDCGQRTEALSRYRKKHSRSLGKIAKRAGRARAGTQTDAEAAQNARDAATLARLVKSRLDRLKQAKKKCPGLDIDPFMEILARSAILEELAGSEGPFYLTPPGDLTLPVSTAELMPSEPAVQLVVTPREVRVGDQTVAKLQAGRIAPRYKQKVDPGSGQIPPLRRALESHASGRDQKAKKEPEKNRDSRFARMVMPDPDHPAGSSRELYLLADRKTACRVLGEVLLTAGRAGYGKIRLAVRAGPGRTRLIAFTPAIEKPAREALLRGDLPGDRPGLTVTLSSRGLILLTGQEKKETIPLRNQEPGCAGKARDFPPTGCFDFGRLAARARALKEENPVETRVILVADPAAPCQALVKTMDALREDPKGALFYDIFLTTLGG